MKLQAKKKNQKYKSNTKVQNTSLLPLYVKNPFFDLRPTKSNI